MFTHNTYFNGQLNVISNVYLNVDPENNLYFLDLIHKFNLNKDHYIIKINHELDQFIDDSYQSVGYINSKFLEMVDYIRNHREESVLGLILMDRILHLLPKHATCIETTLSNLLSKIHENITSTELDDISRIVNLSVNEAKEIKYIRDNVTQFKNSLYRMVADYRSNGEYNPFLNRDGESIFK